MRCCCKARGERSEPAGRQLLLASKVHCLLVVCQRCLGLAKHFLLHSKMEVPARMFGRQAQCLVKLGDASGTISQSHLRERDSEVRQCIMGGVGSCGENLFGRTSCFADISGAARQQH